MKRTLSTLTIFVLLVFSGEMIEFRVGMLRKTGKRTSAKKKATNATGNNMSDEDEGPPGCCPKMEWRAIFLHIGLITTCILYILVGASLFMTVERPNELAKRQIILEEYEQIKKEFFANIALNKNDVESAVDNYIERMLKSFQDPIHAHVFESHFSSYNTSKDLWTYPSAVLFTTTTVIPVGYGFIWPDTITGRMLLVVYGMVGIPLALVTMADTGKFISMIVTNWFQESMTIPTILFLSLLFFYPIIFGLIFHLYAGISYLDAIYFSLTSIFTIGFGDLTPDIPVIYLVFFIVFGVILVTITIDFVAAELIDHVHYMGRHVGKARQIAGKMLQIAQSLNMNKGISGLAAGMHQLHSLARLGMLGKVDREVVEHGEQVCAFAPMLDDMDYMDRASIYTAKSDVSKDKGRHLFVQ